MAENSISAGIFVSQLCRKCGSFAIDSKLVLKAFGRIFIEMTENWMARKVWCESNTKQHPLRTNIGNTTEASSKCIILDSKFTQLRKEKRYFTCSKEIPMTFFFHYVDVSLETYPVWKNWSQIGSFSSMSGVGVHFHMSS